MIHRGKFRKWFVDKVIDPVFPVGKRKMLKRKLFELNTGKKKMAVPVVADKETIASIKKAIAALFLWKTQKNWMQCWEQIFITNGLRRKLVSEPGN